MKNYSVIQDGIEMGGFSDKNEAIKYTKTLKGNIKVVCNGKVIYPKQTLYTEDYLKQAYDAGRWSNSDGKHFGNFIESIKK